MSALSNIGRGYADMSRYEDPPDAQQYYVQAAQEQACSPSTTYNGRLGMCSPNTHYFGCKHEKVCFCGLTERLPLEVAEGL